LKCKNISGKQKKCNYCKEESCEQDKEERELFIFLRGGFGAK